MPHFEMTVTVMADRDPSVNLFTLTRVYRYGENQEPAPFEIRERSMALKEQFEEAWPHPRQARPTLLPVDAEIRWVASE